MARKIAVVTGANKGIGYEIAKNLGERGFCVIVAARDEVRGTTAAAEIHALGYDTAFLQLDISQKDSVQSFISKLNETYGRCDVLVNNAAMAFKGSDPTPFAEQARPTIELNYFATLDFTLAMLPLLRRSASPRIVNVASQAGLLKILRSNAKKARFTAEDLSIDELNGMMRAFINDVESGRHDEEGWPNTCYGTRCGVLEYFVMECSKLGLIAVTRVLAKQEPCMRINACCPGYCNTDMTSHKGPRSPAEGAKTPCFLAALPDDGPTGKLKSNGKMSKLVQELA